MARLHVALNDSRRKRRGLLAVHAHPDDEAIFTGGILARYAAEGVHTVLVTCTDGAVGEISDPALATPQNLAEVRDRELNESVRILGGGRLVSIRLGYRDSGMAGTADNAHPASFQQASFDGAVERLVRVMREQRPQVVVTYDENGGYGHPDHIRAHQVTVSAFESAGDSSRFPAAGAAWEPAKLYYSVIPRSSLAEFDRRLQAAGIESVFQRRLEEAEAAGEQPSFGVDDERVTTTIDVRPYVEIKRAALASHRTQMGPDQFFMRLPPELFADLFSRENFQRVAGPGDTPESDLFAGLPPAGDET